MKKRNDGEVFINPLLRRPSALRSMLPVLLSSRSGRNGADIQMLYPYKPEGKARKTT